jgi:hypothetical protein
VIDPDATGKALAAANAALDEAAARVPNAPAEPISDITGLDPVTVQFLAEASGGPAGEVWAMLGSEVRYLRWKLAIRLADRAAGFLAGRQARRVKLNTLVPLLEAGSLEEDPSMAERWAALLANAANPLSSEVHPRFAEVLSHLAPADARLLDFIVENAASQSPQIPWTIRTFDSGVLGRMGPIEDDHVFRLALDSLLGQRILVERTQDSPSGRRSHDVLQLTTFGAEFARAVRPPAPPEG